jgi:hypothetical protein
MSDRFHLDKLPLSLQNSFANVSLDKKTVLAHLLSFSNTGIYLISERVVGKLVEFKKVQLDAHELHNYKDEIIKFSENWSKFYWPKWFECREFADATLTGTEVLETIKKKKHKLTGCYTGIDLHEVDDSRAYETANNMSMSIDHHGREYYLKQTDIHNLYLRVCEEDDTRIRFIWRIENEDMLNTFEAQRVLVKSQTLTAEKIATVEKQALLSLWNSIEIIKFPGKQYRIETDTPNLLVEELRLLPESFDIEYPQHFVRQFKLSNNSKSEHKQSII